MIAPFVESLATKYPGVTFLKVDVDVAEEISRSQGIQSMPTFQFFLGGNMVDEMKGADAEGLERRVIQHNIAPKEPSEMSIKELKAAIVHAGLASKCVGLSEKQEFVAVLKEYYSTLR